MIVRLKSNCIRSYNHLIVLLHCTDKELFIPDSKMITPLLPSQCASYMQCHNHRFAMMGQKANITILMQISLYHSY